jgi:hypothetical protein
VSDDETVAPRRLRLVPQGEPRELELGTIRVMVAGEERPPFDVDALTLEEDTYTVLSADPEYREPRDHPVRIWTELHDAEPVPPGSVLVREGTPQRLLAVVHDVSEDPTWREEWVASALEEVARLVVRLGVKRLGLQPLGAVHGRLGLDRFVSLLRKAFDDPASTPLERLWVIAPKGRAAELERLLEAGEADQEGE